MAQGYYVLNKLGRYILIPSLISVSNACLYLPLAVCFEQGDYDKSIEICEKAVDEGRSVSPRICSVGANN
jgi:hypothetical protein